LYSPQVSGQGDERHVGEVGALAAEQVLHVRVAFGLAVTEEVDTLYALAAGGGLVGADRLFHDLLGRLGDCRPDARLAAAGCQCDAIVLCHCPISPRTSVLGKGGV
jgi:hypothetical protein